MFEAFLATVKKITSQAACTVGLDFGSTLDESGTGSLSQPGFRAG